MGTLLEQPAVHLLFLPMSGVVYSLKLSGILFLKRVTFIHEEKLPRGYAVCAGMGNAGSLRVPENRQVYRLEVKFCLPLPF